MRAVIVGILAILSTPAFADVMVRDAVGCITRNATMEFYTLFARNENVARTYLSDKERYGICTSFKRGEQVVIAHSDKRNGFKCVIRTRGMNDCVWISHLNIQAR